jgi:glycosyltransferase involved in cell wall biosynthesis
MTDRPQRANSGVSPRVSIAMPVFNTARYLPEALRSIAGQTFADFELVIIDDGSTDGSTQVLQEFAAREPRVRLIARANEGLIATRNELLGAARGELIAWMDSDDVSLPERIARQVQAFDLDAQLLCVGSSAQCVDPDGSLLNVERWPQSYEDVRIDQQQGGGMRFPTTMMRRAAALQVGGFREPFRIGEDLDFLLRLGEAGKMRNLPEVLYLYRQHVASVCAALGPDWLRYRDEILTLARERRESGLDRLQRGETIVIQRSQAPDRRMIEWRVYLNWAGHALANSNHSLALKYARAAVARRATAWSSWKLMIRIVLRWGRHGLVPAGR